MTLADCLASRSADDQGGHARRTVRAAPLDELLEALELEPLGEWAILHITYELVRRGAAIVAPIAARIADRPDRQAADALAEALTELFRSAPAARPAITSALVAGAWRALEAGRRPEPADTFIAHLADCARMADDRLPEAAAVARAYIARCAALDRTPAFEIGKASFLAGDGEGAG